MIPIYYFILAIIIYLAISIFLAGKEFAYWQRAFPEWLAKEDKKSDFLTSIILTLIAPPASFIFLFRRSPFDDNKKRWNYGWTLNYKNPRK